MKRIYNYLKRGEKGFTLVELLIVVIILAVLSGIAVPSYMALRNRARESATETEMKNIATALEMYNADKESYPDGDIEEVKTKLEDDPGYMENVPTADAFGNSYTYEYTEDTNTYTLTSDGVDTDEDSDDIVLENGAFTSTGAY